MVSSRLITNLVFACVVALLALTAAIFIRTNSKQPVPVQEAPGSRMEETVDVAKKAADLERLAGENPQNPDYLTQIGNLYYDSGQYEKAVDFYQRSLSIRPQDPNVETDLATCFHYSGQDDKALEILNKVLEYNPGFSHAMFNKGIVLIDGKKNTIDGIAAWEDLLRSDPNSPHKAEIEERIRRARESVR
jgi:cytochrome c-type biogenesis protein CcmH/NrfG